MGVSQPGDPGSQGENDRVVAADHAQGVQVGDYVTQVNYFGDHAGQVLGMLAPHVEARLLTAMPHDEAAALIARSGMAASRAIAALLDAESSRALVVSLLTRLPCEPGNGCR